MIPSVLQQGIKKTHESAPVTPLALSRAGTLGSGGTDPCILNHFSTGVLISPQPDLLPGVFCLIVRIFLLMLVLLYTYIYIYSTNIPPIVIINRIYEHQNLLSLQLVSFLVGLRTYQHPCTTNFRTPPLYPHCRLMNTPINTAVSMSRGQ